MDEFEYEFLSEEELATYRRKPGQTNQERYQPYIEMITSMSASEKGIRLRLKPHASKKAVKRRLTLAARLVDKLLKYRQESAELLVVEVLRPDEVPAKRPRTPRASTPAPEHLEPAEPKEM